MMPRGMRVTVTPMKKSFDRNFRLLNILSSCSKKLWSLVGRRGRVACSLVLFAASKKRSWPRWGVAGRRVSARMPLARSLLAGHGGLLLSGKMLAESLLNIKFFPNYLHRCEEPRSFLLHLVQHNGLEFFWGCELALARQGPGR